MFCRIVLVFFFCYLANTDSLCTVENLYQGALTWGQVNKVVAKHNALRLSIAQGKVAGQPKASNMRKLVWDDKLYKAAQNITYRCVVQRVSVPDSRFAVGQNIFASYSTELNKTIDWDTVIQTWFDEVQQYNYSSVFQSAARRYTQVVNAETYAIGCGYANYFDPDSNLYTKFYVCNYGPSGNKRDTAPYLTGPGCDNLC